jgi:integral membrane protein
MKKYFTTSVGRLRLFGLLEGLSLLVLVFVAMPLKYFANDPSLVKSVGPVHGGLFVLFVIFAVKMAMEQQWKFKETAWMLFLSSFIPFGTFYIDYTVLRHLQEPD